MCCFTSSWIEHPLGHLGIHNDDIFYSLCHSHEVLLPGEFVKNCFGASHGNYSGCLWVLNNRKKIKFSKTSFLRYYIEDRFQRPHNEAIHGDKCYFTIGTIAWLVHSIASISSDDSDKKLVDEGDLTGANNSPSVLLPASTFVMNASAVRDHKSEADQLVDGLGAAGPEGSLAAKKPSIECSKQIGSNTWLSQSDLVRKDVKSFSAPESSLKPIMGKARHILRQLKINLLDMELEAALPDGAKRSSRASPKWRSAWCAYVKSTKTIYEEYHIGCLREHKKADMKVTTDLSQDLEYDVFWEFPGNWFCNVDFGRLSVLKNLVSSGPEKVPDCLMEIIKKLKDNDPDTLTNLDVKRIVLHGNDAFESTCCLQKV